MKKTILALSVLVAAIMLSPTHHALAETSVSGNIDTDTTWTLANSPYIATGTIQVLQGAKLTIEPGVVVNFNEKTALTIDGELLADGSSNNKIIFHGGTISFLNKSISASFNQNGEYISGSIIRNSIIESGKTIGLNINGCSPYINNNIVRSYTPDTAGLYAINIDHSNAIISDNLIDNNAGTAFNVNFSDGKIINNTITNNLAAFQVSGGTELITKNIIKNNTSGIYLEFQSNPAIQYNNIENNQEFSIHMAQDTDVTADHNYWGSGDKTFIDASIQDYYDNIGVGKVNYKPYALSELKFDGTDTFSQAPICTSWSYSDWSSCSSDGLQSRTVSSSMPSDCTGGSPVLTQRCSYTPPSCNAWTYSDWSSCTNGQRTRTIISSLPISCVGGQPILNQVCSNSTTNDNTKPTCTNFSYTDWSECRPGNIQTRTLISSLPNNCTGGSQQLSQQCEYKPNTTSNENAETPKTQPIVISSSKSDANQNDTLRIIAEEKVLVKKDSKFIDKLRGQILIQVENKGQAWYVNPDSGKKHYLGRPADAFSVMRSQGLGVKNDLIKNTKTYPDKLLGKILINTEDKGKAYYINPKDKKAYYLGRPSDAFNVMRGQGLGISNKDIRKIEVGG